MLHLALALQLAAGASFTAEGWLTPHDGFAHRIIASADAQLHLSRVEIEIYGSFDWWAHADSFPLNAEAGAALERRHGAIVRYSLGDCAVGAWIGRRAVQALTFDRHWGHTLAYWDGVAPALRCRMDELSVSMTGPMAKWHFLYLPYPLYRVDLAYRHQRWQFGAHGGFASQTGDCTIQLCPGWRPGLNGGAEVDLTVGYTLNPHMDAGLAAGQLARPGYGPPVRRLAVFLRVGS